MSKVLRTVATVAGAVALIATGVGAVGVVAVAGAKLSTVAAIAGGIGAAASAGAQLTAPKPTARGSPAQLVLDVEPPRPYIVGQVMTGGVLRHDVAYGAPVAKVPNPYRWQVRVLSGAGPIQGIVSEHFDFGPISSFYTGFYATTQNLGDRPQATALVPPYGPAPGWTSASKLSGCAHVGLNFLFDKDGKVFASGLPIYTALCDGEKSYDPRKDSTFPGGSGPCRLGDESTYVYSGGNPAIEAAMYAYGRFEDGKRIFGLGQPADTIDWAAVVDWANDCDANDWTANIILQEGGTGADLRQQRVRNLDDLCAAGGGRWYQAGGLLSFDWHRPRISLATLTDEDILEAGGGTDAVPTVSERMNGVRPQYVSPDHNWQQITAEEIVGTTYRTEDGQALTQVYPLNGVTNEAQAGELASYAMADSREIGPMDIQAKASWRFYRPGDCITIDSSLVAYDGLAVINQRSLNPETMDVALSLKSETPGKHDFALGKTATPPPTPTLLQTSEERDLLAFAAITPRPVDVGIEDGATRNVARGTYDAGTTYARGDEVLFSGSTYRLIVDSSTGNAPPDALRWALIAQAGSGPAGADGLEGITLIVTNEAHVVSTNTDGSGGDYTGAGGTMTLRRGATVLTPTFSIAARTPATPSNWITINSSTGAYTVSDPGVDYATATIRATWAGVNYDRTYTLAKSKQGVTGPRLALVADNQAFTFEDGAADPSSQTITLTALLNNLSGTATWTTTPSVTLGGSGNTRTLSVANFGTNRQVTVEATLGGITDRITLVRIDRDFTIKIALLINQALSGGADNGEFVLVGVDENGNPDLSKDGKVWIDGEFVTIERAQAGIYTGLTSQPNKRGFIAFDASKSDFFLVGGVRRDVAFVWLEGGQWFYDNNAGTNSFTPNDNMYAIGTLETGAADTITAGGLMMPLPLRGMPEANADVTANAQVLASQPTAFEIQADSAGVTTSNLATIERTISITKGGVGQTSGVTVGTVTRSPSSEITVATPTVSGGIVSVKLTKADAAGSITVPVIFEGKTYRVTIDVRRTLAAPTPSPTNDSYTDQTWANVSGTTFAQIAGDGNCESNGSGVVRIRYAASYTGGTARCKVQYRLESGGSWIDVPGSDRTGSNPIPPIGWPNAEPGEPGTISYGFANLTGLSANTMYRFRLLALSVSGGLVSWSSPVFTVEEP